MGEYPVKCYIYDLSNGLARSMSLGFTGRQIDGIWHTGIVVYGREYFYGGDSISVCPPGGTILGPPHQVEELGCTQVPEEVFNDYLEELSVSSYSGDKYHLLDHNCNTFSDEVARFLTGRGIPSHITNLPQEFLATPMGQMVKPFLDMMSRNGSGQAQPMFNHPQSPNTGATTYKPTTTGSAQPTSAAASPSNKQHQNRSSPASFTADISSFILSKDQICRVVDSESFALLEEVQEYLTKVDCSWAPARTHVFVIDKILHDSAIEDSVRIAVGNLLQNLLLKDDIVMQFRLDPQSMKVLHKLVQATKYYSEDMQQAAVKSLCNVTRDESFRNALGDQTSDTISVQSLCDVCIACILSEPCTPVNRFAAALMYNVTLCKINEEQALGLGSAVVQFLTASEDTESAKYSFNALLNCMNRNAEVAAFAAVMGIDVEGIAPDDLSLQHVKSQIKAKLETVQS